MQISVFDLDHTLLKVNSSFKFGIYLYHQNLMSLNTLLKCLMTCFRHKYLQLPLEKLHHDVFDLFFKGKSSDEIQQQVQEFLRVSFDALVRDSVIERLRLARKRGDYLVISSNSPSFIVQPIAQLLQVDEWLATEYSEDENHCLNAILFLCQGEDKANHLRALATRINIPLTSFTMYSDSHLDLPAMLTAGTAVGVSPNKKLTKICHQRGWEILL